MSTGLRITESNDVRRTDFATDQRTQNKTCCCACCWRICAWITDFFYPKESRDPQVTWHRRASFGTPKDRSESSSESSEPDTPRPQIEEQKVSVAIVPSLSVDSLVTYHSSNVSSDSSHARTVILISPSPTAKTETSDIDESWRIKGPLPSSVSFPSYSFSAIEIIEGCPPNTETDLDIMGKRGV
jgi:hypothetical protein